MPIIPLVKPQLLPDQPGAVLDRNRRPTVDSSEQRAAIGQVVRAGQIPLLPARELAAPYDALGSVGEAIARTGSVIGALAEKREEAITGSQVYRGQTAMLEFEAGFRERKSAHPLDAAQWPDWYQQGAAETKTRILADGKLTPAARERLNLHLDRTIKTGYHDAMFDSNVTLFGENRKATLANAANAAELQEPDKHEAALATGLKNAWIHDYEAEHERQEYVRIGKRKEIEARSETMHAAGNAIVGIGASLGAEAVDKAMDDHTFGTYEPQDELALRKAGHEAARVKSAEVISSAVNGIASGAITGSDDVELLQFFNPGFVTDEIKDKLNKTLAQNKSDKWAAERADPVKSSENAVDLFQQAEAYDLKKDGLLKGFSLLADARLRTQEGANGLVARKIAAKITGRAVKLDLPQQFQSMVTETAATYYMHKDGLHKIWEHPETVDDKEKWVTDPKQKRASILEQAKVVTHMQEWANKYPKEAQDLTKVSVEMSKTLGGTTQKGVFDRIKESQPVPPDPMDRVPPLALPAVPSQKPSATPPPVPAARPSAQTVPERGAQIARAVVAANGGRFEQWANRDIRGRPGVKSKHATGEAVDYYPKDTTAGNFVSDILVAGGSMKRVIYNGRIWDKDGGWRKYTGAHEHRDHIHFEPL